MSHPEPSRRAPTVSIGLPVYNGERYLASAIDSLLSQTFEDFELIISDNASDDGTASIAIEAAAADERVRYARVPENRGVMWNFNNVFHLARGEFFKPAAHDDLHDPSFLEGCVETFRRAPSSVVLVYPRTVLIDADGQHLGDYDDGLDLRSTDPSDRLRKCIGNVRMVNPLYGLHRRSAFATTQLYQSYVSADVVLLAELALRGQFWELPDRLFFRRDHEGRSEKAYRSVEELAAWYDPARTARSTGRHLPMLGGLLKAVGSAPIPPQEKVRSVDVVLRHWAWRHKRTLVRDTLGSIGKLVRRS